MLRAAAVLVSLALHTAAVLLAVALAADLRLPRALPPAPLPGPIRITVRHPLQPVHAPQAAQALATEAHRAPAAPGRGLRSFGRPQFGESLLVRAPAPPLHELASTATAPRQLASTPAPPLELAGTTAPQTLLFDGADGDSARRAPRGLEPLQWSTLLLAAGRARAPAPSEFCVPRRPAMPEAAIEQDVSGRVVARYDVGVTGQATAIEFVNRPPAALAGAVRDWLRGCLFEPAQLNGRLVPVRQEQSFLFVLR